MSSDRPTETRGAFTRRPGFGGVRSWKVAFVGVGLAVVSGVLGWMLAAQGIGLWLHGATTTARVVAAEPYAGRVSPGFIQVEFTDGKGTRQVVYLDDGPGHGYPAVGSTREIVYDSTNPTNAQSADAPGPWGWWMLSVPLLGIGVWMAWQGWVGRLPDVFDFEFSPPIGTVGERER